MTLYYDIPSDFCSGKEAVISWSWESLSTPTTQSKYCFPEWYKDRCDQGGIAKEKLFAYPNNPNPDFYKERYPKEDALICNQEEFKQDIWHN
jgi:hypothetical protein